MPLYTTISLPGSLSTLVSNIELQHTAMRSLERGSTSPTIKPTGLLWDAVSYLSFPAESLLRWNGAAWTLVADLAFTQLNAGGTVPLAANLPAGGFKVTGLAAPTASGEAARYNEVTADGNGILTYLEFVTVQTDASPTTTFNAAGYTPRAITLRLFGDLNQQVNGNLIGTINETIEWQRWNANSGVGFAGTAVRTLVKTVNLSVGLDLRIYIEPKFTGTFQVGSGTLGFWVSLERSDNSNRVNVQVAQALCRFGYGQ